jgi:putative glutathione S-transferase
MGMLVDGEWHVDDVKTDETGAYKRTETRFRNQISVDGSTGFKVERDRYHLYVSLACPWAHRTLIFRRLKKLEDVVSLSIVDPYMGKSGWRFGDGKGSGTDTVTGANYLHEIYTRAKPDYTGRVTVPVLWDKRTKTIVNNESSEIIRMFNSAFNTFGDNSVDFYPREFRDTIDQINEVVFENINNGVYKAGFARRQEPYEVAVATLFNTLDGLDTRLQNQRYLCGVRLTEADWRLFTTLVRFDLVYVGHFKCNMRRLIDYPNLWAYTRELYQYPGVAETVSVNHIKRHYYQSHETINPARIVPIGPEVEFNAPHDRQRLPAAA